MSESMYVWDVSTGMLVADVINDLPGMSSSPASTVKSPTKHVCDISDVFDGSVHATDKSMVELKNAGIMTSPQQALRKLSTAQKISLLGHDVMVARDTRIYRCDYKNTALKWQVAEMNIGACWMRLRMMTLHLSVYCI